MYLDTTKAKTLLSKCFILIPFRLPITDSILQRRFMQYVTENISFLIE